MEQDELRKLEDQCIQEQPPACMAACPVHLDVRAMMAEVARGHFAEALKIYRKSVPFPEIISRVCDQPCRSVCRRGEVGGALAIASIEKACLDHAESRPVKVSVLPRKERRVAVVGGGLSGVTVAFELARKGYAVVIFEKEAALGGSLWLIPEEDLPREAIARDLEALEKVGVEVRLGMRVGADVPFESLLVDYDAVYVGVGATPDDLFGLESAGSGLVTVAPVTFAASRDGVFAGGGVRTGPDAHSPILSISDGRSAAISIDRFLQKVSLTASRSGEGPGATRLFTSIEGVEPVAETPRSTSHGYSREEAAHEAARCLQCQCLECVKVCEYLNSFKSYPRKYVRQVYNNLSIVMGHRHANKLINSCSLCGLCREVCPEDLHMGLVCKKARQELVSMGKMPPSAHDFPLMDMEFSNSEQCAFGRHQPGMEQSRYLFFPGCQLTGSMPAQVRSAYDLLSRRLTGGVGIMARCCGAPADWSGRAELFHSALDGFRAAWRGLGSPELILACSTCYEVFKTHLPEVPISSLWMVLDSLGLPEISPGGSGQILAVHDACTTRHEPAIQNSVRSILGRLGFGVEELPLSRDRTECCGYGGLMFFGNKELARRAIQRRAQESPRDYLAYCAMCRDYLASSGKPVYHLLDLVLGASGAKTALRRSPFYSQRHENRARFKDGMLRELWGEREMESADHETIQLEISDAVQQVMEERQILVEDLQRAIDHAEKTGYRFFNSKTGHFLAHCRPLRVTFWVEYSPSPGGYTVHSAYSHRVMVEEELKE